MPLPTSTNRHERRSFEARSRNYAHKNRAYNEKGRAAVAGENAIRRMWYRGEVAHERAVQRKLAGLVR